MTRKQASAETVWRTRVRAWRASGASAEQFALEQGLSASTLRYWASRLRAAERPRFVQLVAARDAAPSESGLVVEVGAARVRVTTGFDASLLAEVVRALSGVSR